MKNAAQFSPPKKIKNKSVTQINLQILFLSTFLMSFFHLSFNHIYAIAGGTKEYITNEEKIKQVRKLNGLIFFCFQSASEIVTGGDVCVLPRLQRFSRKTIVPVYSEDSRFSVNTSLQPISIKGHATSIKKDEQHHRSQRWWNIVHFVPLRAACLLVWQDELTGRRCFSVRISRNVGCKCSKITQAVILFIST